jgi:hypothetical protein
MDCHLLPDQFMFEDNLFIRLMSPSFSNACLCFFHAIIINSPNIGISNRAISRFGFAKIMSHLYVFSFEFEIHENGIYYVKSGPITIFEEFNTEKLRYCSKN